MGNTHHCAPENSIIMTFGQMGANWTIGSAQEKITATQNHIVELLVNKPSIRMYILMLDTRNVVSNETNERCTYVH